MLARMSTVSFGIPEEGTMAAPVIDTELLHRRLVVTGAALQGARAAFVHSPNADNAQSLETAERRMDQLLDQFNDLRGAE